MKTKERKVSNGITEPVFGSKTAIFWTIASNLKKELKRVPSRFEYMDAVAGYNEKAETPLSTSNAKLQFHHWRKFHGIGPRASGVNWSRNGGVPAKKVEAVKKEKATPAPETPEKKAPTKTAKKSAKKAADEYVSTIAKKATNLKNKAATKKATSSKSKPTTTPAQ